MATIGKKELLRLVTEAVKETERSVEMFSNDDNPQVVDLRQRMSGALSAYRSVQWALEGDIVLLKIAGRGVNQRKESEQ
jgi:hypothetical protein